ncbi:Retrotransposable element Tf2 [Cucumis melo var. makuwa]|uniref:Retrotransposable element Tf2 n=1 Tax=Cucumis melo var. makuwa TaxID=1194695 RepID=A0A5D3BA13_CUCMM|nr:Retrotransposable element Tf2 [Cucumis melo var. makuwa]
MSAENYAMDLQFEQVSRRRQGFAQRTLTIQSDSSSLPPIPSTALLHPSGPTTPNKHVAPRPLLPQGLQFQGILPLILKLLGQKYSSLDLQLMLGPSGNFKALSKSLRIKWWENLNYSHLEVNKIKDWFKANIHLQDMTRQEDESLLVRKNAVMSTLAGASTQEEFNYVVNNVVVNLLDDNDDLPEDASPTFVNDVDDLDYDPYKGLDINDPLLDTQPY